MRDLSDRMLIEIIEQPKNADSEKRKDAIQEIQSRTSNAESLKEIARQVNESIAYTILQQDPIAEDTVEMHTSYFLHADEMRKIYIDQLEKYMRYRDGFRYDVWAHALGGLL